MRSPGLAERWRMLVAISILMFALLAGTTMAGAHATDVIPNAIHACVNAASNSVDIVGANGQCTGIQIAVHWSIQGPPGAQGPQGLKGDKGDPGTLGSFDQLAGLACTAPGGQAGSIEVTYRIGVARLRCLVAGVRFIDNRDGTITDQQTGLMWEMKDGADGVADTTNPRDVDNFYTWANAMGEFLDRLNGRLIATADQGGFAGYSDWRVPTLAELRTIIDLTVPGCRIDRPCIDPIFDPAASALWSASTIAGAPTFAWVVFFDVGVASFFFKGDTLSVRAVRGGW